MQPLTVGVAAVEGALLVALWTAYRRGNTAAVINTVGAISLTLVPPLLAVTVGAGGPELRVLAFWIAVAGLLHALGMLGRYDSVWWWDHLTHTLSAALAAALLYAGLLVVAPAIAVAGTVLTIVVLGVLWEAGELFAREVADRYDIEPVLVHYGWRDTALDLLFDIVGAGVIVALDVRLFRPVVEAAIGAV